MKVTAFISAEQDRNTSKALRPLVVGYSRIHHVKRVTSRRKDQMMRLARERERGEERNRQRPNSLRQALTL